MVARGDSESFALQGLIAAPVTDRAAASSVRARGEVPAFPAPPPIRWFEQNGEERTT